MSLHLQYNSKNHQVDLIKNKKGGVDVKLDHKVIANFLEEDLFNFTRDIILDCKRKEKHLLGDGLNRRRLELMMGRKVIIACCRQKQNPNFHFKRLKKCPNPLLPEKNKSRF